MKYSSGGIERRLATTHMINQTYAFLHD